MAEGDHSTVEPIIGRHAGILAHSAEGAALCFREYCQEGFRVLGPHLHPDVTLDCVAMGHSMSAWECGDYTLIRAALAGSLTRLAKAGADFFICPDNTAHIALEEPGDNLALPGLHIADVVADRAARDHRRLIGVLGTRWTMDGPIYQRALTRRGLGYLVPPETDREIVDGIIFDELVNGIFTALSRLQYARVIAGLAERGCDSVVLACTEIPLLVSAEESPLPILDSTRLLAQAAFEVAVGRRPAPSWRGGPVK